MDFSAVLGRRVKELRKQAGLSQDQAAERAGISGKYLGQVERGEVNVSTSILHKLAGVFEVRIEDFFVSAHLSDVETLRNDLIAMIDRADEQELRLIHRILSAVLQ